MTNQTRNPKSERLRRHLAFGPPSGFGFRISDFRSPAAACVGLVLFLALAAAGRGETVLTNEGKAYTGKVTVTAHLVRCVSPGINRTFALPVVKNIELSGPERMEFEVRSRKLAPLDAQAYYQLGMWLKSGHQHGMALELFEKAVKLDADHVAARAGLGYVREGDAWVYSPALHQQKMYDWVGRKALDFHLKMAQQMHALNLKKQEEQELRRVLQADGINPLAISMIRPLIAGYRCRNRYKLPFRGRWLAISGPNRWGHGRYAFMMNAWDFRRVDEQGRLWSGDQRTLKNHYTFEQPVYACADGEVYEVRDSFPDNPLGTVRPLQEGNRVLIRHANGERSVIGHLQKGSVKVKVGDKVKQGHLIGRIGNSGRSATPHIHLAIFDADGISLPMTFVDYYVVEPAGRRHVESGQIELGRTYENSFDGGSPLEP